MNASISVCGAPAARMSRSPQVSHPRRRLPTGEMSASGACSRSAARSAAAVSCASAISRRPVDARPLFEGFQDERFLLRAHALEIAEPSLARRALEVVERADAQIAIEHRDGLRSDALEAEEVQDGWRKLLEQISVVGDGARVDELDNLGVEILADAGDRRAARPARARRCARRRARSFQTRCDRRGS